MSTFISSMKKDACCKIGVVFAKDTARSTSSPQGKCTTKERPPQKCIGKSVDAAQLAPINLYKLFNRTKSSTQVFGVSFSNRQPNVTLSRLVDQKVPIAQFRTAGPTGGELRERDANIQRASKWNCNHNWRMKFRSKRNSWQKQKKQEKMPPTLN